MEDLNLVSPSRDRFVLQPTTYLSDSVRHPIVDAEPMDTLSAIFESLKSGLRSVSGFFILNRVSPQEVAG